MMAGGVFLAVTRVSRFLGWDILHCELGMWKLWFTGGPPNRDRFFAGQMHVFRPRIDLARTLVALAPLVGAALIAISRCEDYRHDVYDVTVGSLLGFLVANFVYRAYYPALRAVHPDVPYPVRSESLETKRHAKVRDEEAVRVSRGGSREVRADERLLLRGRSSDRE